MDTVIHIFDGTKERSLVDAKGMKRDPLSVCGAPIAFEATQVVLPHDASNACTACVNGVTKDESVRKLYRFPMLQGAT